MAAGPRVTTAPPLSPRANLSSFLAQQVLSLIREGDLKPGDRLPSAKDLAARFSVATPTMREALRRLQATGVIDIRHGSGIYVRRDRDRLMLSNPAYGELETHTILQVLDARVLIEPHLARARRPARRRVAAHGPRRARVARSPAPSRPCTSRTTATSRRTTISIWPSPASPATPSLMHVVEALVEIYSAELHLVDPTHSLVEIRARDHGNHQRVVAAIEAGDETTAAAAMHHHIDVARSTVATRLPSGAAETAVR
jgi:GntR family transcriptional repressor for pyruvate dehydrogenase complex